MSCGRTDKISAWSSSERRDFSSAAQLLAELVVLMGGRAAEEAMIGSASTLCEGDLTTAAELAGRIERAQLRAEGAPTATAELQVWAKHDADRLVAAEPGALDLIGASLRTNSSMFVDEICALVTPGR